jgi:hypothetical protein
VNIHPARFRHSPGTLYRSVGGDVLVAAPDREDFDLLAGAGSAVWHLLDVPRTLSEIVEMTGEIYGMPATAVAADVEALVDELIGRHLIEEVVEADR